MHANDTTPHFWPPTHPGVIVEHAAPRERLQAMDDYIALFRVLKKRAGVSGTQAWISSTDNQHGSTPSVPKDSQWTAPASCCPHASLRPQESCRDLQAHGHRISSSCHRERPTKKEHVPLLRSAAMNWTNHSKSGKQQTPTRPCSTPAHLIARGMCIPQESTGFCRHIRPKIRLDGHHLRHGNIKVQNRLLENRRWGLLRGGFILKHDVTGSMEW